MAPEVDRQALLTALTTEHFTLQGARSATISESSARSSIYLGALSASLVSLGFVAQASDRSAFRVFALLVLPTMFVLGLFTFVRLVETSVEDIRYGRAINRIRHYYLELAGPESRYFLLEGHDDAVTVLRNMGLSPRPVQLYLTSSAAVGVVNSIVGGAAAALAIRWAVGASLAVVTILGVVLAIVSVAAHIHWSRRLHERVPAEVLFPSAGGSG